MAAMARLNRIWWCNTTSFARRFELYKSLVTSILLYGCKTWTLLASRFELYRSLVTSILLYGCKTWTLLADSEKGIQSFETKCLRKFLCISYLEHKTNEWTWSKINFLVGPQEPLLATGKRQKLAWFGHVTHHNSLSKTIPRGTFEGG